LQEKEEYIPCMFGGGEINFCGIDTTMKWIFEGGDGKRSE